jgi:cbb3-type cytochrome oxidase subunit 3
MNTELSGMIVLMAFSFSFLGIIIWALWPANKAKLERQALIPFAEDTTPDTTETHHV